MPSYLFPEKEKLSSFLLYILDTVQRQKSFGLDEFGQLIMQMLLLPYYELRNITDLQLDHVRKG